MNADQPLVADPRYHGDGREILLQGFHWRSHAGARDATGVHRSWYRIIRENAAAIRNAGFSWVWFPPSSDSLAPQGYIPRRWNVLDSAYGSEQELRAALTELGPVRAMADVVLNHRVGVHTSGADFEDPPFKDNRAAICRDDESGAGTGATDTGERHPCGRDLDHTNADVRSAIKAYLGRLKGVGFQGWRYDLTKGFGGQFVGEYNEATQPRFSVGEYYETNRQQVCDWVGATGDRTCAFDFPTRYRLFDACMHDDYGPLRQDDNGRVLAGGLIGFWPGRAVTFVDNHDTEYTRDKDHEANYDGTRHFPGPRAEMAYAYILTHPGQPCVFWQHYFDWGPGLRKKIDQLLQARKRAGLFAWCPMHLRVAERGLYAAEVEGTRGRIAMKLGTRDWTPGHGWSLAVCGDRYAVWTRD